MLISSRLFPAALPNRELSYCFSKFFMINFTIVYIWPIYQNLDKRIWFTIHFQDNLQWLILFQFELSRTELLKCTPSTLMEMWHTIYPVLSILFYMTQRVKFIFELEASYSFRITCVAVRQVVLLRKLMMLSAKFTI